MTHPVRPSYEGRCHGDLVELLESTAAPAPFGHAGGEHEDRCTRFPRLEQPGGRVCDRRPFAQRAYGEPARLHCITGRHVHRVALVPARYEVQAGGIEGAEQLQVVGGQPEAGVDPVRHQEVDDRGPRAAVLFARPGHSPPTVTGAAVGRCCATACDMSSGSACRSPP